jgi:5-methylcytosine-specific restriction protein A
MTLGEITDASAVTDALDEFDAIGRAEFLTKYKFKPAHGYFVVRDGKRYDSKAIVGAAHGYQTGTPLLATDFNAGEATVAKLLEKLGFEVARPVELPDWTTDELILALDVYLRTRSTQTFNPSTQDVIHLSDLLRSLPLFSEAIRADPRFRNPNGVALKVHNFSALDESHAGAGMSHGGAGDRRIWQEWSDRPEELATTADAIRAAATDPTVLHLDDHAVDEDKGSAEGRILHRLHQVRERDRSLVKKKLAAIRTKTGRLACEVCDFESAEAYGDDLAGVIDVHHVVPLSKLGETETRLDDLALLCPTCHRVLHKHRRHVTPTELRALHQQP